MMVKCCVPSDNNATTNVSTSHRKIEYVTRNSYHFKTILDDFLHLTSVNNLPVICAAQEAVMNVDTGAATTYSKL